MDIVYRTIEEMVEAKAPEAVLAFNTIYDHLSVVEYCVPRGIHIMVEKPLAVNLDHAEKMAALAAVCTVDGRRDPKRPAKPLAAGGRAVQGLGHGRRLRDVFVRRTD